ncbi:MAG: hypothetical protein J07HQX50_00021 [Haloquadratum sp. J07HQX50]|jgi:hypothetical protein|nr:MAG: hypothetical protein J07HQX50_00021 [Haloquadratum sp. J07HQX50]
MAGPPSMGVSEVYIEVLEARIESLEAQGSSNARILTERTRFTPTVFAFRFRQSVGTLVTHERGGFLSISRDSSFKISTTGLVDIEEQKYNFIGR